MSKLATVGLVFIALVVLIGGVTIGLRSGYSQFAAVSFGLLPALFVIFPIVRERSKGKVTFMQWVVMLFMSVLFAVVVNNIVSISFLRPGN